MATDTSPDVRPPIGTQWLIDGEIVTVVPTGGQIPAAEVNVMDFAGSIRTVRLDRLQPRMMVHPETLLDAVETWEQSAGGIEVAGEPGRWAARAYRECAAVIRRLVGEGDV